MIPPALTNLAATQPSAPSLDVLAVLWPYRYVFVTALLASLLATPLMRWLAIRNGVVDMPDFQRKQHARPVPYLGGVALFLAWMAAVLLSMVFVTPHNVALTNVQHVSFPVSIILGATIITITGLMDDVFKASPRVKIGGQLIAAAMLAMDRTGINLVTECFQAVGVQHPPENLCYILGTILIALMVVGGCNAMNLLDGMDGLASGATAIAGLGFLFLATHVSMNWPSLEHAANPFSDPPRLIMCLAMLGAVLGFLPYNSNPARIFMGDAGSLLLGYLCVTTIMLFGHTAAKAPGYAMAAVIVLALPITDTTLAIVRRTLRGQPISMGDKQHLHHQLLARGWSVKQAVLTLYALAAAFAALGGAMVFLRVRYVLIVFLALFGTILTAALVVGRRQARQ